MRSNGHGKAPGSGIARTADALSHVRWQTDEAIALPIGAVRASGEASPQVRSPERLAAIGDADAQVGHIQRAIVEALAGALVGLEPAADDLHARRDEIASLTLVAANMKLGAVGVALLDLTVTTLDSSAP